MPFVAFVDTQHTLAQARTGQVLNFDMSAWLHANPHDSGLLYRSQNSRAKEAGSMHHKCKGGIACQH